MLGLVGAAVALPLVLAAAVKVRRDALGKARIRRRLRQVAVEARNLGIGRAA